jgi:hypothetical protein
VARKLQKKPLSQPIRKAYELHLGCNVVHQDKIWVPKISCCLCSRILAGWLKGTHKSMPFAVPMVWHEPRDCFKDCYFGMTKIIGFSQFSMHKIQYPNIPFVLRPVPHDESMPLPKLPKS